jgi:pyridoxamine 5'-phosphate oxidase
MMAKKRTYRRREYLSGKLPDGSFPDDPLILFLDWLNEASRQGGKDHEAMALATAGKDGRPSVRMVLLKEVSPEGLVFYSNYESRKGMELEQNPYASVLFYWPGLDRQLRVEGIVDKTDDRNSDAFFDSRPLGSRVASAVSPQSQPVPGRAYLEEKFDELLSRSAYKKLKRPSHWGGYVLRPMAYEFWQGRENRLNDRIRYELKDGTWHNCRLAP